MRHPETSPISTPAMGVSKTRVMELTEKTVDKKNLGKICFVIVAQAFLGGNTWKKLATFH